MSCTEDMWELGLSMLEEIEKYIVENQIPVLAGGVFPTFAPEIVIKHFLIINNFPNNNIIFTIYFHFSLHKNFI